MKALQLLKRSLAVAMTTTDEVTAYLDKLIEHEFCDAKGLRIQNICILLVVPRFKAHDGTVHTDLHVPVVVDFDTSIASRAKSDTKQGCGFVTINPTAATGDITTLGGVRRIARTGVYFDVYKSTLVHEFTHVLDVASGIPRFIAAKERVRIAGETPAQYRVRYHASLIESRAFTRQLLYVLSIRLEAKLARMGGMARLRADDIAERDTLLTGAPEVALDLAVKLKLVPLKMMPWLDNISNPEVDPAIKANLLREFAQLQAVLRDRYSQAVYHGA